MKYSSVVDPMMFGMVIDAIFSYYENIANEDHYEFDELSDDLFRFLDETGNESVVHHVVVTKDPEDGHILKIKISATIGAKRSSWIEILNNGNIFAEDWEGTGEEWEILKIFAGPLGSVIERRRDKWTLTKKRYPYVTYMGLPILGLPDGCHYDGLYNVPSLTVRGVTYRPAWIEVQEGKLVRIGMQPHLMLPV